MRAVADQASVSVKTVEALYRTKAELLKAAVDYAIAKLPYINAFLRHRHSASHQQAATENGKIAHHELLVSRPDMKARISRFRSAPKWRSSRTSPQPPRSIAAK